MKFSYRNQAFYKINPEPIQDLISNPVSYLSKRDIRCPFYIKIFNIINWFHDRYHNAHPSHATIAKYAQCHINTVKNVINLLVEDGILVTLYRHMSSCIYKVSSYFSIPTIRAALSKWIPSFNYLSLAILFSFSNISNIEKFHTDKLSTITKKEHSYATSSSSFVTDIKRTELITDKDKSIYVENSNKNGTSTSNGTDLRVFSQKNKESVMKQVYDHERSYMETMEISVPGLPLTEFGKIKLAAFPNKAINYAISNLHGLKNATKAFGWFYAVCKNYCEKNNIVPNYDYVNRLFVDLNVRSHEVPMLDPNIPVIIPDQPLVRKVPNFSGSQPIVREKDSEFQKREKPSIRPQFEAPYRPPREKEENWKTPRVIAGVENFAKLIGEEAALGFFNRNKRNMTIEEVPLAPNTNEDAHSQSIIGEIV